MTQLTTKYEKSIIGTLSGWDRLVLRGSLRMLCFAQGMMVYLSRVGVLLKNFGDHAQALTERLTASSLQAARQKQRPIQYLTSPKIRKDELAREIAQQDNVEQGLIAVLPCVEPCKTYEVYRNRSANQGHTSLRRG